MYRPKEVADLTIRCAGRYKQLWSSGSQVREAESVCGVGLSLNYRCASSSVPELRFQCSAPMPLSDKHLKLESNNIACVQLNPINALSGVLLINKELLVEEGIGFLSAAGDGRVRFHLRSHPSEFERGAHDI
jgi:hypothetical protein